jgi:hypothetical protein
MMQAGKLAVDDSCYTVENPTELGHDLKDISFTS